ncbi:hypothetical protein [Phenylobacterium sp. J367]|uniref:hypothetical protein n=1 Tax=Phenylobacterium sp. J367 TaxID=2898435 RepID=UPI0021508EA1|nr:hypothetical protein [Phenylobacterium sp. J367]MCR5881188.1 hypothetical protein [Phenylobacterium sp. J367]
MAAFTRTPLRVTDSANAVISGGKLRLYDAGTTNLTPVFSDAGLTTPLTNPVVAASNGWLPMIYAAEGTAVDGAFLDASNNVLSGQSFEDSVFVGDNSGDIERDFGANGRFSVNADTGGMPNVEFGDPTGDDTGGEGRIGGWAGTQGDALELDFATVSSTGS